MRALAILLFLLLVLNANAQDWKEAIEKNRQAETALVSGEVNIVVSNEMLTEGNNGLPMLFRFYHDGSAKSSYFLLETDNDAYFSNEGFIQHHFRGLRRIDPDGDFPGEYGFGLAHRIEPLFMGYAPGFTGDRPFVFQDAVPLEGDTSIQWDPVQKTLRIWGAHQVGDEIRQRFLYTYTFNDRFLIREFLYQSYRPNFKLISSQKKVFSYTKLNQVNYLVLRQRIDEYRNAPVLFNSRPQPIEADVVLKPGVKFPDLELMDSLGNTSRLSDIRGKRILIYPTNDQWKDTAFLSFIDSMEDLDPNWNILLVTWHSVDNLALLQRRHPGLRSLYLASMVSTMPMNGFPVWLCIDEKGLLVEQNHGFAESRKGELVKWVREVLKERAN